MIPSGLVLLLSSKLSGDFQRLAVVNPSLWTSHKSHFLKLHHNGVINLFSKEPTALRAVTRHSLLLPSEPFSDFHSFLSKINLIANSIIWLTHSEMIYSRLRQRGKAGKEQKLESCWKLDTVGAFQSIQRFLCREAEYLGGKVELKLRLYSPSP